MHELPATQRIIEIASERAREAGAERVSGVTLVMGDACGYLADSLLLYFDLIAEGTACEGARLEIRHTGVKFVCPACGEMFEKSLYGFDCPECGTLGKPTEFGREFFVESVRIGDSVEKNGRS